MTGDSIQAKDALACLNLKKSYHQGPQQVEVLQGVNLEVKQGERLAIIGSSGSGKSTLLNLLGGLDQPTAGEIWVAGEKLSDLNDNARGYLRNRHLGFVYQFHHLLGEFTALENVAMPLLIGKNPISKARQLAMDMLRCVGLKERVQHKPSELSGGERQRVAIARAMVTRPSCVLMDEPTGNLDQDTAKSIQNLMMDLNQQFAISFVIVTHDQQLASTMDRVLELRQGKLHISAKASH